MGLLRVESAETGDVYVIHHGNQLSFAAFQAELGLHQPIPPADQILLIGPPFKPLETLYNSLEKLDGKRIFLFNRRVLLDLSLQPHKFYLQNFDSLLLDGTRANLSQQPSSVSLPFFQEVLAKAKCYEQFVSESVSSFRKLIGQLEVQRDAVSAAIDNMCAIFRNSVASFMSVKEEFSSLVNVHEYLLVNFDSRIAELQTVYLDDSLAKLLGKQSLSEEVVRTDKDFTPKSLYDCIPMEEEKLYFKQCKENHLKIITTYEDIQRSFSALESRVESLCSVDHVQLDLIRSIIEEAGEVYREQAEKMNDLREKYQSVYILHHSAAAISVSSNQSEQIDWKECFNLMENRCEVLRKLRMELERNKQEADAKIYTVLRVIASIQSDIQFKFKKELEWLRKMVKMGDEGYFKHLKQIFEVKSNYQNFLLEIRRRQQFEQKIQTDIELVRGYLEFQRNQEIKKREEFMTTCGVNLPPLFFRAIPSLREKPSMIVAQFGFQPQQLPSLHLDADDHSLPNSVQDGLLDYLLQCGRYPSSSSLVDFGDIEKYKSRISDLENKLQAVSEELVNQNLNRTTLVDLEEFLKLLCEILEEYVPSVSDRNSETELSLTREKLISHSHTEINKSIADRVLSLLRDWRRRNKYPVISFMDFRVDDIALFMPAVVNNKKIWMAFNSGFPYHFLDEKSLEIFVAKNKSKEQRASIIGKISSIQTFQAKEDNTYNIPVGTLYHVCEAQPLYRNSIINQRREEVKSEEDSFK